MRQLSNAVAMATRESIHYWSPGLFGAFTSCSLSVTESSRVGVVRFGDSVVGASNRLASWSLVNCRSIDGAAVTLAGPWSRSISFRPCRRTQLSASSGNASTARSICRPANFPRIASVGFGFGLES